MEQKIQDGYKEIYNLFGFNEGISAWHFFRNFLIDGILHDLIYSSNENSKLTDEQYKIRVYKTFVNNSKLEKKYNKLVEKYKFCSDEEIIKYIDNMLVKLWRQMAQRC